MSTSKGPQEKHSVVAIPYRTAWLLNNKGVLAEVASQLGVSREAVSKVWRGKGRSKRVERALRRRRVPGFEAGRKAA